MKLPLDFEALRFIWAVLMSLAVAASAFAQLWLGRHFVRRDELDRRDDTLFGTLRKHNDRITVCEQTMMHLPTGADLRAVRAEIAAVRSELHELRGQWQTQNRVLESIHQYLLNRSTA